MPFVFWELCPLFLVLLKSKPGRQLHLQQLQCGWWQGASCRSRPGRCSYGSVQWDIDRKGLTQLSQTEINPFSTGWWFREGREITDLYMFPFITSVAIPMVSACQFPWWAVDWQKSCNVLPQLVRVLELPVANAARGILLLMSFIDYAA